MLGQWPRLRLESPPLVGAQKTCCPRTRVPEPVRKQHYSDDRRLGHVEVRSGWCVCLSVPGKSISWWVPFGWRSVPQVAPGLLPGCQISEWKIPWPEDPAFSVDPSPTLCKHFRSFHSSNPNLDKAKLDFPSLTRPTFKLLHQWSTVVDTTLQVSVEYPKTPSLQNPSVLTSGWHWSPRWQIKPIPFVVVHYHFYH
jgi:hypothetical protein